MTTILYERTGGFMGRKVSLTLELDSLPSDQSETLRGLLETCGFFSLPASSSAAPVPDEFFYRITVNTETIEHTVEASDTGMDESLRPLVEELGRLARKG
jgi:hypothetical protein